MKALTLNIRRPDFKTAVWAIIIFLFMFGSLEGLLRTEFFQSYFERFVPSYGSRHRQLEIQLARLETFAQENGQIDCLMLGSSLVWLGFNPDQFEGVIFEETGQRINCLNFGVETLPAGAAGDLAQILVNKYQPKLLIYGTSARDYAPDLQSEDMKVIEDAGWVQYQLGSRSPWVWFQNYSYIYRYAKQLQLAIRFDTEGLREAQQELGNSEADTSGFLPKTRQAQEVHFLAAEKDAARLFHPYTIYEENLKGLEQILDLQASVRVLVVEMPVSDQYYGHFENDRDDYDRFVEAIVSLTAEKNVQLLRTSNLQLIPDEGWWDRSHMNLIGANIFSQWLAVQVIELTTDDSFGVSFETE